MSRKAAPQWVHSLILTFLCLVALLVLIGAWVFEGGTKVSAAVSAGSGRLSSLQFGVESPTAGVPPAKRLGEELTSELGHTVPVSITESGFEPQVVTITVGTAVEWTNHTEEPVRLVGGTPCRVYLPLVLRNALGGTESAATLESEGGSPQLEDGWGSGDIPAGGSFRYRFNEPGRYPYFLGDDPSMTGLVVVEPILSDFTLGIAPSGQSVVQGQAVTYTVGVTTTLGESLAVTLTVGGLPSGVMDELHPATVVPTGTAVLTVSTPLTTSVGEYALVVTGTGGTQVHTATALGSLQREIVRAREAILHSPPLWAIVHRGSVGV
jgi:plastocyanin